MAGYTRQSTMADGDTITAALFNNEYNQLVNAFSNTSGHAHDGTAANGPVIGLIGDAGETSPNNKVVIDTTNNYIEFYVEVSSSPVQQLYIADGAIIPVTDNDIDLGTSSLEFKDLYIDGTANLDSLVLGSGSTVTAILDEDDLSSDSATSLATQQSIKAYVDAQVTAQDLDFQGDSGGALSIDLDSESLTIAGGTGIDTSGATNTLTVAIDSTVATLTGSQTLTNKTLTTPVISSISNTGTLTLPTSTDTLVGRATTDTLTNKTLDADNNTLSNIEVDNFKASAIVLESEGIGSNDNDTTLPTSAAVKDYVDTQITAEDLDVSDGTSSIAIDLDSETLGILGGTGLTSSASGNNVTLSVDAAQTQITSVGTLSALTVTGEITANGGIALGDNDKATFGDSDDLEIFHDGTNSVIQDTGTGSLILKGSNFIRMSGQANGYTLADFVDTTGEAKLFHQSNLKLATTSSGIDVTGTAVVDGLTVDGQATITTSDNNAQLTLISTDTDALVGPQLNLWRNSGTGSNGDLIGQITFTGEDTVGSTNTFASIFAKADQADNGAEDGSLRFSTMINGTLAERMLIDSSGNVGIGTTSPSALLSVSAATTDFMSIFTNSTSSGNGLRIQAGDNSGDRILQLDDKDGNEKLRVNATGNVGIGTASPSSILHLYANDPQILLDDLGTQASITGQSGNILYKTSSTNRDHTFFGLSTEVARITGDGNVGIGTSSPDTILEAEGNSSLPLFLSRQQNSAGVGVGLGFRQYDSTNALHNYASIFGVVEDNTNGAEDGAVTFHTSLAGSLGERMRIDSSGNVGIGIASPTELLHVYESTSTDSAVLKLESTTNLGGDPVGELQFFNTAGASSEAGAYIKVNSDSTGRRYYNMEFGTGRNAAADTKMIIDNNGLVGIGTSSPSEKLDVVGGGLGVGNGTIKTVISYSTRGVFGTTSNHDLEIRTNNTERMRIDASGNVGIGVTSVSEKLQVAGNITAKGTSTEDRFIEIGTGRSGNGNSFIDLVGDTTYTDYGLRAIRNNGGANATSFIQHRGTGDFTLRTDDAAATVFQTNATERMRIDSSGNVGIGMNSTLNQVLNVEATASDTIDETKGTAKFQATGGNGLLFGTQASSPFRSYIQSAYVLDTSLAQYDLLLNPLGGNVGIGTTSPDAQFHIEESSVTPTYSLTGRAVAVFERNAAMSIVLRSSNTGSSSIDFADAAFQAPGRLIYDHSDNSTQFVGNGSERMRIDSSGNVGINESSPDSFLHIDNGASGTNKNLIHIEGHRNENFYGIGMLFTPASNSTPKHLVFQNTSGTGVGSITSTSTNTAYNTSSDARLKDITGSARGLEVINELNPVSYNWKESGEADEGLIAQEVLELVPNAVTGSEEDYYQMDYSKLVVYLVKGMQEQQEQIESLKSEIELLKGGN